MIAAKYDLNKAQRQLQDYWDEIREQIREYDPSTEVRMFVFCNTSYNGSVEVKMQLSNGYGTSEIQVESINWQNGVDEFVRRLGFKKQQELLLAGPVEGTVAPPPAPSSSDEIPF